MRLENDQEDGELLAAAHLVKGKLNLVATEEEEVWKLELPVGVIRDGVPHKNAVIRELPPGTIAQMELPRYRSNPVASTSFYIRRGLVSIGGQPLELEEVDALTNGDRQVIQAALRAISEETDLVKCDVVTCSNIGCDTQFSPTFRIGELDVYRLKTEGLEIQGKHWTWKLGDLASDGFEATFRLPIGSDRLELTPDPEKEPMSFEAALICHTLVHLETKKAGEVRERGDTLRARLNAGNVLRARQWTKIIKMWRLAQPGVDLLVMMRCPGCKGRLPFDLEKSDFLVPAAEARGEKR